MSLTLKPGTAPELNIDVQTFREQIQNNRYCGIPTEYFTVSHRKVTLDAEVATKLSWTTQGGENDVVSISALPAKLTLNGRVYRVQPGAFYAWIPTDALGE